MEETGTKEIGCSQENCPSIHTTGTSRYDPSVIGSSPGLTGGLTFGFVQCRPSLASHVSVCFMIRILDVLLQMALCRQLCHAGRQEAYW